MKSTDPRVPRFAQFHKSNLNVKGNNVLRTLIQKSQIFLSLSYSLRDIGGIHFFISHQQNIGRDNVPWTSTLLQVFTGQYQHCKALTTLPSPFFTVVYVAKTVKDETFLLFPIKTQIPQIQCSSDVTQTTHQMCSILPSHTVSPRWDSGAKGTDTKLLMHRLLAEPGVIKSCL